MFFHKGPIYGFLHNWEQTGNRRNYKRIRRSHCSVVQFCRCNLFSKIPIYVKQDRYYVIKCKFNRKGKKIPFIRKG